LIRIAILGGHSSGLIVAESVGEAAAAGEPVCLLGLLNDTAPAGTTIGGYPVLGRFEDWRHLAPDARFIAAFPLPGHARERHLRLRSLQVPPDRWQSVRDPRARVSRTAEIGAGCYLAANVVVEHGAHIGAHTILRAGAYVSHDARIGEFGFVGPSATLLGRTTLGDGVHVGANAVVREGTTVHEYAVVGIGSVVVDDVAPHSVVAGNPARPLAEQYGQR
jgi:acetyltransferase EpsM